MEVSPNYNRLEELKAFDESKAGVKGVVDAGISKIPRIFIRPADDIEGDHPLSEDGISIPVIDLGDCAVRRSSVVDEVRRALGTVGIFQMVNHGIPTTVLDGMLSAARAFHELPAEVKAEFYTREVGKRVRYSSNFYLYKSLFANWRDTLSCFMGPDPLSPDELPEICRDMIMEYSTHVKKLGITLFELLSEALGLQSDHLLSLDCAKGHVILSHYYPQCPQPELTLGSSKHTDADFLNILLQDPMGGLQILHQNHWINVPPVPGALIVNIGDVLQLMSNDKFKSLEHRVLVNDKGPRISVACFFSLHNCPSTRKYGPIKDLLSDDNPPLYKEITFEEYFDNYNSKGLDGKSSLAKFKI